MQIFLPAPASIPACGNASSLEGVSEKIVWIDCEMTGLSIKDDALIEVAVLVTDGELNVLDDEGIDLVIKTPQEKLDSMNDFVHEMHVKSGLLEDLKTATLSMAEAEQKALAYIKQFVPSSGKAQLGGNSVGNDRNFLARDMPELEGYLHYRNIDVSTIKELAKRWFPKAYYQSPVKNGNHRALADIQESIEELRYYRDAVFVAGNGPDSETAREIAAKHQGEITGL